jgi:hypothetical protein
MTTQLQARRYPDESASGACYHNSTCFAIGTIPFAEYEPSHQGVTQQTLATSATGGITMLQVRARISHLDTRRKLCCPVAVLRGTPTLLSGTRVKLMCVATALVWRELTLIHY